VITGQSVNRGESAVSEVIGSILLISVVVIGVAIVGVVLMSHSTPQKIPALSAVISEDKSQNILSIYHDGGDPIEQADMKILVDGVPRQFSLAGSTGWSTWSMGQSLTYPYTGAAPGLIQIVYSAGSGSTVLASSDFGFNPSGTSTAGPTGTATPVPTTNTTTPTPTASPTPVPAPVANFTGNPLSGTTPLTVQFTDQSSNIPSSWAWNFGDGNTSIAQNPSHTYSSIGVYTVSLNATNAAGSNTITKTNYVSVTISNFTSYIIQNNVFVYGTRLNFGGNDVNGDGATIIITGPLYSSAQNGGAHIAVSTIYIDGDVTLNTGSVSMGSSSSPGAIYINGNLYLNGGSRDIYGDVYVAKNLVLQDCRIHGNMYINGDVNLPNAGVPTLDVGKNIYYTGTLTYPSSYSQAFIDRCIKQTTVPPVSIPSLTMPSLKPDQWYQDHGYSTSTGGTLTNNLKIFASSYSSSSWGSSASNVVIVASTGDITLSQGNWGDVTGVLYAPNGKVTFNGGSFTGVVIASNGFYVTSGGSTVTFTNLANYFSSQNDYPF
jgi:PKD repeat protein